MTLVKLGELCAIRSGGTPSRNNSAFYGGQIPWAKISDIETSDGVVCQTEETITNQGLAAIRGRIFPRGTLLFAIYGSIGKMAFAGQELSTNQAILGIENLRPDALCERYLFRYLESRRDALLSDGAGIAQKNLSAGYVRDIEIPLPPLGEQKRIAAILDQADELRRKRQHALDRLNQLGQAIFIEMFGDLTTSGIDAEPLGSLTSKIGSGATPKGGDSAYKSEGIPLIRSMNVRDGHFLDKGLAFIDDEQASKLDNVVVRSGDVLLNITGASVARVCTAPASMDGARVNQHVSIIRPTQRLLSIFVEAYLLIPLMKEKLLNIAESGATRQAITKAQIEQLAIPVPPIRRQNEFVQRVRIVQRQQDSSLSHHTHLDGLFASLQHRAFRGELTASSLKEAGA